MTTIPMQRPPEQYVLEDQGYTYERLAEILAGWDNPPAVNVALDTLTVDALWHSKGEAERHVRDWSEQKGRVTQELERRVKAAHPEYTPETGGSVEIVGENLRIAMTYSRTEKVNTEVVSELAVLANTDGSDLSPVEYDDLVKWEPKVNGTKANTLKRRGGDLAEILSRVKMLTGARPDFEAKAR